MNTGQNEDANPAVGVITENKVIEIFTYTNRTGCSLTREIMIK